MTVADRRDVAGQGLSFAADLARVLAMAASTSGPRPLVTLTRSIDAIDPITLFGSARDQGYEAALWLQPGTGRSIVGIGRAWAFEDAGPRRFAAATTSWRSVVRGAVGSDTSPGQPGEGPILIGGLGFTGSTPADDDPWAPFGPASLVLPEYTVSQHGAGATLTVAIAPGRPTDPDPGDVERAWTTVVGGATGERDAANGPLAVVDQRPDRATWERTVGMFAGAVGRGRIDKVVLARRVTFQAATTLDAIGALRHLAATAPESTTFAFDRGGTTFMGATPERLVRTHGRTFETTAIAGSAARGRDQAEDDRFAAGLLASEKDREEHEVVVDMLRTSLKPIVESLDVASAPAILPLRHLQHLVTPVTGTTRDDADLLTLAGVLHPTPAVGGAPRDVALQLIEEHEAFDRGWYAGPIGWLGADGDGELMVALRCGLVSGSRATLFAGCGIVADSDPTREWEESRLKFRTMISALGGVVETDR